MTSLNKKTKSIRAFAGAIAMGACMTFSTSSQAAAFQVDFDPDLFLGVATFELTAPCLANDGLFTGLSLFKLGKSGCLVSLLGAHITIDGGVTYTDYVPLFPPFVVLSGLSIENHLLAGLGTFSFLPIVLNELEPPPELLALSFASLQFEHECHALLGFTLAGDVSFQGCGEGGLQPALYGEITSITQVPEPATLALIFGAGLAGWLTRRRKRAV